MRQGEAVNGAKHSEKCRQRIETEMRKEGDPRSQEQKMRTLNLKLRRCKPNNLSMLGGHLKQPAEGEEKTQIPFHKLQHPAHLVQLGTSTLKKQMAQRVGQLWRP